MLGGGTNQINGFFFAINKIMILPSFPVTVFCDLIFGSLGLGTATSQLFLLLILDGCSDISIYMLFNAE